MKVLKTHLTKVINELLLEPTVDDVLDHMRRDLREVGVEDFGILSANGYRNISGNVRAIQSAGTRRDPLWKRGGRVGTLPRVRRKRESR